jgi:hypothetical protein
LQAECGSNRIDRGGAVIVVIVAVVAVVVLQAITLVVQEGR